jgi:hypothetical protein
VARIKSDIARKRIINKPISLIVTATCKRQFMYERAWDRKKYILQLKGKSIPLQAFAGPEGSRRLRVPDFKTVGTWRWQDCQPYAPAAFTPRKYSWYSFLLEDESTPVSLHISIATAKLSQLHCCAVCLSVTDCTTDGLNCRLYLAYWLLWKPEILLIWFINLTQLCNYLQ